MPHPIKIEVKRRKEEEAPRAETCFYAAAIGNPDFEFVALKQYIKWNGNAVYPGASAIEIPAGTKIDAYCTIQNKGGESGDAAFRIENVTDIKCVYRYVTPLNAGAGFEYRKDKAFTMPDHDIEIKFRACHYNGEVDCCKASGDTATFTLNVKPEKEMQPFIVEDDTGIGVDSAYVKVTWYGGSSEDYTDGNGVVSLEVNSLFKLTAYASKNNYVCYNPYCDRCVSNKCYRDDFTYLPTASMRFGLKKEGVAPPPGDAKAIILSKSPSTDRNFTIGDTVDVELIVINWGEGRGEIKGIVKKDGAIFTSCEGSADIGDKISTKKSFVMPATTVALDFFTYHKYPAGWPDQYDEFESVLLTPVTAGTPKWGLVEDPVWKDDDVWFDFLMLNPRIERYEGRYRYTYRGYLDLDGKPAVRGTSMDYDNHTGKVSVPKRLLDSLGYTATIKLRVKDRETGTETWIDEVTKIIPKKPSWICPICGLRLADTFDLFRHIEYEETPCREDWIYPPWATILYPCTYCGMTFTDRASLTAHSNEFDYLHNQQDVIEKLTNEGRESEIPAFWVNPPSSPGFVNVATSGYDIYLDKVYKGISPKTVFVAPNKSHNLRLVNSITFDIIFETTLTVSEGETKDIELPESRFEVTVSAGVPPCTASCNRVYKVPLLPLYIIDPLWSPLHESCLSSPCSFGFALDGKYIGDTFGIAALSAGVSIFTFPESEVYTLTAGATPVTVSGLHAPLSTVDVLMPALGISVDSFVDALKLAFDFITETEWRELGRRVFNKSVEDFIMVLGTLWERMPTKAMSDILILLVEGVGVYTVRDAVLDSFLHHSPIAFVAAATAVLTVIAAIIGTQIIMCWLCEEWLQGLGLGVWAAIDVGNWELAKRANATLYKGLLIYCTLVAVTTGVSMAMCYGAAAKIVAPLARVFAISVPAVIGSYFLVLAWAVKTQHDTYEFIITDHLPVPYKPPMKGEITGAIKITSEPAGASIYIKQEGVWEPTYMTTPQTLVLPVGTHDFMFYLLDWKNIEWEGEVSYSLSKHRKRDETVILKEIGSGLPKEPTLITNARVIKVVDGDTIHVTSPDIIYPLETPGYLKVRILGMNTPDIKRSGTTILGYYARRMATVGGEDVRWDIEKEIYTNSVKVSFDRLDGKTVTLRSDIDNQWGTHDRFLATVEVGGADYGAEMLSLGHAAVFFYSPNAIFDAAKRDEYINLYEKPAKDAEIGIWAPPPIVEPDTGKISCKSSPSTAEIWLDGKDTEYKTPKTLDKIAIGEHTVTFKAPLKCTKTLEQCRLLECSDTVTVEEGKTKPADCNLCGIYEIHTPYYCSGRRCATGIPTTRITPSIYIDGNDTGKIASVHTIIKFGTDIDGNVFRFGTSFGGAECGFGTHTIELKLFNHKTVKATEKIDPGDYFEITPEIPEGDPGEEVEPIKPVPPVVEMTGTLHIGHAFAAFERQADGTVIPGSGLQISTGDNKFPLHVLIGGVKCDCRCWIDEDLVFGDGKFCNRKDDFCPLPLGTHTFVVVRKHYDEFEFTVTINAGDEIDAPKIDMIYDPFKTGATKLEESIIPAEIYLERPATFEIAVENTGEIPVSYKTRVEFHGEDNDNLFSFASEWSEETSPGEVTKTPVQVTLPTEAIPAGKEEAVYTISTVLEAM